MNQNGGLHFCWKSEKKNSDILFPNNNAVGHADISTDRLFMSATHEISAGLVSFYAVYTYISYASNYLFNDVILTTSL